MTFQGLDLFGGGFGQLRLGFLTGGFMGKKWGEDILLMATRNPGFTHQLRDR